MFFVEAIVCIAIGVIFSGPIKAVINKFVKKAEDDSDHL